MRFAIIGTGTIAEFFIEAGRQCPDFELTGVYSRSLERAQLFAGKYTAPETYDDLQVLARSRTVDAVYIASPNSCHFEQAMLMLQNGKHVLCEKPIATNSEELTKMLNEAKKNGIVLLEAARHLFSPGTEMLRSLLPKIGTLRRVSLVMNQYSSRYDSFKEGIIENAFRPELACGALMDIGFYCVSLMAALFGMPENIVSSSVMLHTGVDGQGAAIAQYDGFLAELSHSKISQSFTPSVIQGEEGSLIFKNPSMIKEVDIVMRNGEKQSIKCDSLDNQLVYEITAFIEMVNGNTDASKYNDYSKITQEIMDVIKQQWTYVK